MPPILISSATYLFLAKLPTAHGWRFRTDVQVQQSSAVICHPQAAFVQLRGRGCRCSNSLALRRQDIKLAELHIGWSSPQFGAYASGQGKSADTGIVRARVQAVLIRRIHTQASDSRTCMKLECKGRASRQTILLGVLIARSPSVPHAQDTFLVSCKDQVLVLRGVVKHRINPLLGHARMALKTHGAQESLELRLRLGQGLRLHLGVANAQGRPKTLGTLLVQRISSKHLEIQVLMTRSTQCPFALALCRDLFLK